MLPISGYQGEEFSTFPSASSPLVECNEDQTNAIVSFLMTIITEKDKVLPVHIVKHWTAIMFGHPDVSLLLLDSFAQKMWIPSWP